MKKTSQVDLLKDEKSKTRKHVLCKYHIFVSAMQFRQLETSGIKKNISLQFFLTVSLST